jgi:KDO transferase-3
MASNFIQRTIKRIRRPIWEHIYPRSHWHMRFYDRRFEIGERGDRREVRWCGRHAVNPVAFDEVIPRSQSIAIVASGPSLLQTPEGACRERDICCVNGSILWARQRGLRPLFYVVSDPGFAQRRIDLIELAVETAETVCLPVRCLFEVLRQRPGLFRGRRLIMYENINQPFRRAPYTREELSASPRILLHDRLYQGRYVGISVDLRVGVFPGGTVVLGAAQIALALGYRDLQFIAVDMKQTGPTRRFYEERRPEPSFIDHNFERLILPSFALLRRYCDGHGVSLQNWSLDSAIPRDLVPAASSDLGMAAE